MPNESTQALYKVCQNIFSFEFLLDVNSDRNRFCSIFFPFRHLINAGEAERAVDQRGEHTEPIPNLINI